MYLSVREIYNKYNIRTEHLLTLCNKKQIPYVIKEGKCKIDKYHISEDIIKQWLKNRKEYQDALNRGMIPISKFIKDNKIKIPCFFIYIWIKKKGAPIKKYINGLSNKIILGYPNDLKKWYEKNKKDIIDFKRSYERERTKIFRERRGKPVKHLNASIWQPFRIISNEEFENNLSSILSFYKYVKSMNSKRRNWR